MEIVVTLIDTGPRPEHCRPEGAFPNRRQGVDPLFKGFFFGRFRKKYCLHVEHELRDPDVNYRTENAN